MKMNSTFALLLSFLAAGLFGGPAYADGFKIRDLTTVEAEVASAFAPEFYHWAITEEMNLSCCDTEEDQIISIVIDRHTDEIGQQNRTDEVYIAGLDDVCTNKGIPCQSEEIDAGAGIGRLVTTVTGCCIKGANVFIVRDRYRLTIRSAADDADIARKNAETALEALRKFL